MAGMTGPQSQIIVGTPTHHGRCTVLGYARDWRPAEDWWGRQCEFIEPLGAVGPAARQTLTDTTLSLYAPVAGYNDAWRTVTVAGNPCVDWLEFGDGEVYAETDDQADFLGAVSSVGHHEPRLMLTMWRYPPPAEQGIDTMVAVKLEGSYYDGDSWEDADFALVLPLATAPATANLYSQPFMVWRPYSTDFWDVKTDGTMLAQFAGGGRATQEVGLEQWLLEYEEDTSVASGGHILLRNLADPGKWCHFYSDNFRLKHGASAGHVGITVQGSVHLLNVTQLTYGDNPAECGPPARDAITLPAVAGNTWEDDATWGYLATVPAGWTVVPTKETDDAATVYRPRVTMTRTGSTGAGERPILWYVYEDHAPTVEVDAHPSTETVVGRLLACEYTMRDNWRGASGSAEFLIDGTELGETWERGSYVALAMGQQSGCDAGLECAQIATAAIKPDGITRRRDGNKQMGLPDISVEFADWVQVRVAATQIVDCRQAGGRTAAEWYVACWARLGMDPAMVDVAAGIASTVITVGKLPSAPAFEANDGDAWAKHFDDVCNAMNWRWGIDKAGTGRPFLDAGPAAWVPAGEPDFVLDITSNVVADIVTLVEHTTDSANAANCVKASAAPGLVTQDGYCMVTDAVRAAGVGHDFWFCTQADAGQHVVALATAAFFEKYKGKDLLRLVGPIRREWRPDQFVRVDACSGIEVAVGSVWRMIQVRHRNSEEDHESEALAVWVAQEAPA